MYAKDIMTTSVVSVTLDDSVKTCAKLLMEHQFSGLPVIDEKGQLVGIVTESDLIKRASNVRSPAVLELLGGLIYLDNPNKYIDELKRAMAEKVKDLMSTKVVTINEDDTIEQAATTLLAKKFKRLPVVDSEGKVVGIISRRDILSYLYPASIEQE
ncbi:hypothetical protein CR194_03890 [Salipaludibacillus keqinensis]|uniref:CBS domain-containing protein n=1 Tax=Salipaludibacillus keqinensis TaxID=2045207 RepID=A0A323THS6_9BACI|nr:CBS domain-containing protein [Salipaludibacillus keqinensis]PYZ94682.1 hypothetical protein CR194_03890 [Salipaludibacillus keqinensis]